MKGYVICKVTETCRTLYATLDLGEIVGFIDLPDLSCLIGTKERAERIMRGYSATPFHSKFANRLHIEQMDL